MRAAVNAMGHILHTHQWAGVSEPRIVLWDADHLHLWGEGCTGLRDQLRIRADSNRLEAGYGLGHIHKCLLARSECTRAEIGVGGC